MKKLFSSLLAATMLAGASITAFAYVGEGTSWDTDDFDGNDYAIIGAYDEDGKPLKKSSSKVESGDKIYYPILISGDEIDKDETTKNGNSDKMYFANKASEINNLKAYVKDEIGGKYIDGASIVKKDIEITKDATTAKKDKQEVLGELKTDKKDTNVSNAKIAKKSDLLKKNGLVEVQVEVATTKENLATFTEDTTSVKSATVAKNSDILRKPDGNIEVKVTVDSSKNTATLEYGKANISIKTNGSSDQTAELGDLTLVFDTAQAGALKDGNIKVGAVSGYNAATPSGDATLKLGSDSFAIKDYKNAGEQNVKLGDLSFILAKDGVNGLKDGAKVAVGTVDGYQPAVTGLKSMGKVYCVEVKMADYYKSSETEVEFNIKLKNKGKTEFDTDDDKIKASDAFFNGTFDLGTDADIFNVKDGKDAKGNKVSGKDYKSGALATKFKKGDIEIKVGKHTRTLQLDEAINKDGNKEDIDNIFLESDDTIDNAFTFDVKASDQDDLYLELNQDANKDLAVSNQKADLEFFNFPGKPEFDFSGTATFAVEDEDEDNYFYEVVDGELTETNAKYDRGDGVFKLRTNKLGSYVISDRKLDTSSKEKEDEKVNDKEDKVHEQAGGDPTVDSTKTNGDKSNANTGAADLIGVASALAVVSVATAGVVALKK